MGYFKAIQELTYMILILDEDKEQLDHLHEKNIIEFLYIVFAW